MIGSAIACALAERGVRDVCVADLDLAGRYASSELNAGGARATWWQEVNIAACRDTLAFFAEHAAELSFRACGYLWLYADRELLARARERRALQERLGVRVDLLEPAEVARRFPLVDRNLDELCGATFSPGDGLFNPNALRKLYQERAIAGGARFLQASLPGAGGALRARAGRARGRAGALHGGRQGRSRGRVARDRADPDTAPGVRRGELDQVAIRPECS